MRLEDVSIFAGLGRRPVLVWLNQAVYLCTDKQGEPITEHLTIVILLLEM